MPTASKMNSGTMMMAVNCGSKIIKINAKNSHDQIMDDLALARFWKLLASPRNIRISALKSIIGVICPSTTDGSILRYE